MEHLGLALVSALIISAVSLIGAVTLVVSGARNDRFMHLLVSLAAGAMLGNAFLHLLPHSLADFEAATPPAVVQTIGAHDHGTVVNNGTADRCMHGHRDCQHGHSHNHDGHGHKHHGHGHDHDGHGHKHHGSALLAAALVLVGILGVLAFDMIILTRAGKGSRLKPVNHMKPVGYLVLMTDGVENFIDGMVVAAAFMVNPAAGFATAVAVLLHELPVELGDFAVLRHAGFSAAKALVANLASGLLSVAGVLVAYLIGGILPAFSMYAGPIAAGAFIYIAASCLLPHMRQHGSGWDKLACFGMAGLGILLMAAILLVE